LYTEEEKQTYRATMASAQVALARMKSRPDLYKKGMNDKVSPVVIPALGSSQCSSIAASVRRYLNAANNPHSLVVPVTTMVNGTVLTAIYIVNEDNVDVLDECDSMDKLEGRGDIIAVEILRFDSADADAIKEQVQPSGNALQNEWLVDAVQRLFGHFQST
jgi:hypothetical protein